MIDTGKMDGWMDRWMDGWIYGDRFLSLSAQFQWVKLPNRNK